MRKINKKYIQIGIITLLVVCLSLLFNHFLKNRSLPDSTSVNVGKVMLPIIDGCALAYFLNPLMKTIANKIMSPLFKKLKVKNKLTNPNLDFLAVADIENDLIIASPEVYAQTGLKSHLNKEETRNKYPIGFGVEINGIVLTDADEIEEDEDIKSVFNKIYSSFYNQITKFIKAYKERNEKSNDS